MKYYIKDGNGNYNQVHVEIEPKLSKAFDTTNDSLSCVLRANNKSEPYEPMTLFKIKDDNNNEEVLWIINDTVDIFSLKPLRYKHTLSIVQYRYFTNKHLIRNTVFNQPRKNKLELYGAVSSMARVTTESPNYHIEYMHLWKDNTTHEVNYWGDKLPLNNHTKIKTLSWRLKIYGGVWGAVPGDSDAGNWVSLSYIPSEYNLSFNLHAYFTIVDANNSNYSILKIYLSSAAINSDVVVDATSLATINSYIANHQNALLKVQYWVDNAGSSPYGETIFSFVNPITSYIPILVNNQDNPAIYTDSRYRYLTAQLYINLEIYNYTMYDVIETLLNQSVLRNSGQGWKIPTLFKMPESTSDLYTLLKNTYPPDTLTFTQATFYDALTEIFRFYDAGFKFKYKNENHYLDIEYYNNPIDEVEPTLVGKQMSHSDKNYNNGRIAYYQNALLPIKMPRITIRSQSLGVPGQNDFGILTEKPIYNMGKLSVDVWDTVFYPPLCSDYFKFFRMNLDLTPFVVNEEEYTVLDKADPNGFSSGDDLTKRYQIYTLHFTRGGNFINASETYQDNNNNTKYVMNNVLTLANARYFGYGTQLSTAKPSKFDCPEAPTWENFVFSIEYLTMNNGRSTVETATYKYDGNQIANQNTGIIDLNKLGLNILGEALKDGEPTLTANCVITNWNDRIKEGDYFIDDNNDYWVANIVNYTELINGKYRCSVEFSKNFNALALRVNSDKEKRLTSVSSANTVLSEDNFIDYIYVEFDENRNKYTSSSNAILNNNVLASMICQTFKDYSKTSFSYVDVRFGLITTYNLNGNYNTYGSSNTQAKNLYIPILKYGAGNCVCFEMQYKDALSAGNRLTKTSGWFGTSKYFSSAALYTDDEGWADRIYIDFCDLTSDGERNKIGDFPIVEATNIATDDSKYVRKIASINDLYYYKKPNEIFALNYEWCFLTAEPVKNELFIGNKFINENFFTNKEVIAAKKFFLKFVYDGDDEEDERYSILDTKGFGQNTLRVTGLNINLANNKLRLGFKVDINTMVTAVRWAIVDENNDIYFASNNEGAFTYSSGVYQLVFFLNENRIKDF